MAGWREFGGGWRWWTPGGFLYLSLGTDINWVRIEVGPVEVTVHRRLKWEGRE